MEFIEGSIASPLGIQAAGVSAGLKDGPVSDLALVICKGLGTAAAVFTQNQVQGHSLKRSRRIIDKGGPIHAILINSGNANACVGSQGDADAETLAEWSAKQLGQLSDEVITMSTGIIGQPLPMETIKEGLAEAVQTLGHNREAGQLAEEAILTTDTVPKSATVTFEIGGVQATLSGMAKGSGMIHPNMATLLGVITTDCVVDRNFLQDSLRKAVEKTFNRVTIDGETSPCDMVVAVSSGLAGNEPVGLTEEGAETGDTKTFAMALETVLMRLARMIAGDGEGATKLIDVRVEGAETSRDALEVALSVARSPQFKTAMFGEVPDWGRIIAAVGNAVAVVDPDRIDISLGQLEVCREGALVVFDEERASRILSNPEIIITIDLGRGAFADHYWTCDYSYDYVKINSNFHD